MATQRAGRGCFSNPHTRERIGVERSWHCGEADAAPRFLMLWPEMDPAAFEQDLSSSPRIQRLVDEHRDQHDPRVAA
jgi:hypothetical protein